MTAAVPRYESASGHLATKVESPHVQYQCGDGSVVTRCQKCQCLKLSLDTADAKPSRGHQAAHFVDKGVQLGVRLETGAHVLQGFFHLDASNIQGRLEATLEWFKNLTCEFERPHTQQAATGKGLCEFVARAGEYQPRGFGL